MPDVIVSPTRDDYEVGQSISVQMTVDTGGMPATGGARFQGYSALYVGEFENADLIDNGDGTATYNAGLTVPEPSPDDPPYAVVVYVADYGQGASSTFAIHATPNAPTGLTATTVSASQINLAWTNNSATLTGFKLERSSNGTSGWAQIATPAAGDTSASSIGLSAATTYYYRVRATNPAGDSDNSNTAHATTQAAPAPPNQGRLSLGLGIGL